MPSAHGRGASDRTEDLAFLANGGEMGGLLRAHDWSTNTLGPPRDWPQSLRTAVRLMLNTGHPMYIFWGEDGACLYNDAYRQSIGAERHPSSIGRPAREVWDEIWDTIGPQIEQVMAGRGATWHENQLLPITRNGRREDVYWTYSYGPIDETIAATGVGGVLVVCTETTVQAQNEVHLVTELERQRQLLEQMPGFVAVLTGPDHVFTYANEAYHEISGPRDIVGHAVRDVFPELSGQGFYELLDQVYATGERFAARALPIQLDGDSRHRFIDLLYEPIHDATGQVTGIFVGGYDVTEQTRARAHQRLLIDELNHRVKNTLATVQSIVAQTLRASSLPAAVREDVDDRLIALASAHDLLTRENWQGADMINVVGEATKPFGDVGASRFRIEGPNVRLGPRHALAFAMALQELATNAVKYGALATPTGQVRIAWRLSDDAQELQLRWTETGGPPVTSPSRRGFGVRLLQTGLSRDLDGTVRLHFDPAGVVCEITCLLNARSETDVTALEP